MDDVPVWLARRKRAPSKSRGSAALTVMCCVARRKLQLVRAARGALRADAVAAGRAVAQRVGGAGGALTARGAAGVVRCAARRRRELPGRADGARGAAPVGGRAGAAGLRFELRARRARTPAGGALSALRRGGESAARALLAGPVRRGAGARRTHAAGVGRIALDPAGALRRPPRRAERAGLVAATQSLVRHIW